MTQHPSGPSTASRATQLVTLWRRALPATEVRVDLAFSAALVLLALVGFSTTYYGYAWLVVGVVGTVLGLLVAHVVIARRLPAVVTLAGVVAAYLLLGGPVAVREALVAGVLPTPGVAAELATTAVQGWKTMLTSLPPLDARGPLMALPFLFALGGAAAAYTVARRWRRSVAALVVPLALLGLSIALGTLTPASVVLQGGAFALVAIGWSALRTGRGRPTLQDGGGRGTRAVTVAGLLAVAVVGGLFVGPRLPGAEAADRQVWRTALEPPFDVSQFPSPLAGFRQYTEPNAAELFDRTLIQVTGLPEGTPVRLATLDSYDGSVWGAGNIAAGSGSEGTDDAATFRRVGSHIAASGPGQPVTATVRIVDPGYREVWLPTAGVVTGIAFDASSGSSGSGADRAAALAADLRYNVATNTGVVPSRLQVGDSYELTAILPSASALPTSVGVEGGPLVDTSTLGFLDARLDAWSGQQTDPWAKVVAIARAMRAGAYTDGGSPGNYQNVFLPGHSLARLQRFVRSEQLAGDDEQYASTLALAANRAGVPTRVVFGAIPEANGDVKGADVHAWVEVHAGDGSWVPVLPRDFLPDRNKQPEQQQQRSEEQKTGAQVPPPVANNPPSVLQGPDQAQNATQNRKPPIKSPFDPSTWPDWVKWLLTYVGLPLLVLLLLYAVVRAVKARRRVRRRTRGPARSRISGGWAELVDTAADLGWALPRHATRLEQAGGLDARVAGAYAFRPLAERANGHVFAPDAPTLDEATAFWVEVKAARRVLRKRVPWWRRLLADVSPRSAGSAGSAGSARPATRGARRALTSA
ncbi:MAG: transglutaminaseTgpA domain-containing protein [Lapillicoccus sp.]